MSEAWTKKWKEVLIWFSGYVSFIAYAIVGGYVIVKSSDEDLKKTVKKVFIFSLIFSAVSALLLIFNYFGGMVNGYYSSSAYRFYSISSNIVNIAKIVVFAVFIIKTLVKKEKSNPTTNTPQKEEN